MPDATEPWMLFFDDLYEDVSDKGDVVSDTKVYEWTGDNTSLSRWASQNSLSLTPPDGVDSGNHIEAAEAYHDWTPFGGTGLAVVENAPEESSNNKETSVGLSIGYNGISINWTYTQLSDVNRTVDETQQDKVKYEWGWGDFDGGEDESTFETGTEVAAETAPGLQDQLFRLDGLGAFAYDGQAVYEDFFTQYFEVMDGGN